ncbi:MAG: hypothetical protein LH660_16200, partial [Phormidesmis sp. CAN_BIN36]|nr:hypothetical protein [Phormidesmis sp. CAN_BIN36]
FDAKNGRNQLMVKTKQYNDLNDQTALLLQETIKNLGPALIANPELAELLNRKIDDQLSDYYTAQNGKAAPVDGGLGDLIGLGKDAPTDLGDTEISRGVVDYDDTLKSARILAAADLYYICIHERLGVFRVMNKLQELFRAGTLRISDGEGAYGLYRFDKHNILRYHQRDRMRAYSRVFGYARDPGPGARPNPPFHGLFSHFIGETAKYWRDKRISEVIRDKATDPTFGSVAIVRRAGLDLRNNLKNSAYGYINVLRVETSQALAEAFRVLEAPDVRSQFGADNAWELIELVLWQYFHESVHASTLNRMAVTGRDILRWLAEPFVLQKNRTDFEALLYRIAESAEEWISSEEGMRISRPTPPPRQVYMQGSPPIGARRDPIVGRSNGLMPTPRIMG